MNEGDGVQPLRSRLSVVSGIGTAVAVALAIVLFLFFIPLPVLVFGPGDAVDLNTLVVVPDRSPPPGTLYLTDVKVMPGRPAFYLAGKLLPGFEVVPRRQFAGDANDAQFDRELEDAMRESQKVAEVVAERAAGLDVRTATSTTIVGLKSGMPAATCFRIGDTIEAIDGRPPSGAPSVAQAASSKPLGATFAVRVQRDGKTRDIPCTTAAYHGKALFGMVVSSNTRLVSLPVHVKYDVKDINGSSAGLMFALQIYRTLTGKPLAGGKKIAGTGVLTADGTVLPVGGAIEKLRAAISQGAQIFLVPTSDYARISQTPGIVVVSVGSFADALARLRDL